jgi:hypothetical protein
LASRFYEIIGVVCGLVLINYGFSTIAGGMPGTRMLTSQFLGANLLIGGCAVAFLSLYYLLKPVSKVPAIAQQVAAKPDVGIELVVVEETPAQVGFYKNIEYIGYFFTALGLFSAADLALQVFIPQLYNETRWWIEVLLVTFGVLSYAIFFSIGRIGSQEEKGYVPSSAPAPTHMQGEVAPSPQQAVQPPHVPETLELRVGEFSKTTSGDYEKHLSGMLYDMFRIEKEMVTVWREDRVGIRSVYLAGPYELSRKIMQDSLNNSQDLKVGNLSISTDELRELLDLQHKEETGIPATTS